MTSDRAFSCLAESDARERNASQQSEPESFRFERNRKDLSASAIAVALTLGLAATPSYAADDARGFTHCAPPFRPLCIDSAQAEDDVIACEIEVQAFIATVFKYRECLERETERAVRDANDAIETWKCRSGKSQCRN